MIHEVSETVNPFGWNGTSFLTGGGGHHFAIIVRSEVTLIYQEEEAWLRVLNNIDNNCSTTGTRYIVKIEYNSITHDNLSIGQTTKLGVPW